MVEIMQIKKPNKIKQVMKNTKAVGKITGISMLFSFAGCSSMNSSFDCPNKPGVSCHSLDQVNDMVDKGIIGKEPGFKGHSRNTQKFHTADNFNIGNSVGAIVASPLRAGEQVVRIWTAPYEDVYGNYHNEGVIYTVVNKNTWFAPKEIIEANSNVK